jgi:hypothetical protein
VPTYCAAVDQVPNPRRALRALTAAQRADLVRLANRGERHPDPAVAVTAHRWAHGTEWRRWWNRVPGWLLPAASALVAAAIVLCGAADLMPMPTALVVASACVVPLVLGLLAWSSKATARTFRAVYPAE